MPTQQGVARPGVSDEQRVELVEELQRNLGSRQLGQVTREVVQPLALLLELPEQVRAIRCGDCGACSVDCPNGVRVRDRVMRAQELLA